MAHDCFMCVARRSFFCVIPDVGTQIVGCPVIDPVKARGIDGERGCIRIPNHRGCPAGRSEGAFGNGRSVAPVERDSVGGEGDDPVGGVDGRRGGRPSRCRHQLTGRGVYEIRASCRRDDRDRVAGVPLGRIASLERDRGAHRRAGSSRRCRSRPSSRRSSRPRRELAAPPRATLSAPAWSARRRWRRLHSSRSPRVRHSRTRASRSSRPRTPRRSRAGRTPRREGWRS